MVSRAKTSRAVGRLMSARPTTAAVAAADADAHSSHPEPVTTSTARIAAPAGDINDNVARLVGHEGAAVTAFARGAGRVFIDGKEWAAELDDGEALEAGASVKVVGVEGARLRVRRI